MTRTFLFLAVLVTLSLSSCQFLLGSYGTTTRIEGAIEENRYHHPDGYFSMEMPDLYAQGALIQDGYENGDGSVAFSDDFGQFVRVDVVTARTSEAVDKLRHPDWENRLNEMHAAHLDGIQAGGVEIKELHCEFVDWRDKHVLFSVLEVPEGSTMAKKELLGATRLDALRFFFSFVEGESIYMISSQYTPDLLGNKKLMPPILDLVAREKNKLIEIANTLRFNDAKQ